MEKDYSQWHEEQIKEENDFLKMKLMLENGAEFGGQAGVNPAIENRFLKDIIEFEKQSNDKKTISVFDKLGRPVQFKPVTELKDHEIDSAWNALSQFMYRRGVSLGVCSPNVSTKELYRFVLEELFNCMIDDIDVPGLIQGFIYDEFYPDVLYDNTRIATEDCMQDILKKSPLEWMNHFRNKGMRLNDHYPLNNDEFKAIVNRFKAAYEDIELNEIADVKCDLEEKSCKVTGKYLATVDTGVESYNLSGRWKVEFAKEEFWRISVVEIENIRF
jgi:hypothetical protein